MRSFARSFVLLLAAITTWMSQSCGGGCNAVGCGPAATILADVPASWEQLQGARVRFCRNGGCKSASLPPGAQPPTAGFSPGVTLVDEVPAAPDAGNEPPVYVFFNRTDAGTITLEGQWSQEQNAATSDTYQLSVTGTGGEVFVSLSETAATATRGTPNGASCGPDCLRFTVDHRRPVGDR